MTTNSEILLTKHCLSLGLPHTIVSDNGTNFTSKHVANFCSKYRITHRFSTSYNPQGKGQAEINNHTILNSLCKSLDKAKGKWVKDYPGCSEHTEP